MAQRYDRYWGGPVALAGVQAIFIPDPQGRVLAVQNGEVDIAAAVPATAGKALAGSSSAFVVRADLPTSSAYAALNLTRAPLDDPAVRQALSLGIDWDALSAATSGSFLAAHSLFPPYVPYAQNTQLTDRARATQLLDAAGWVPGSDGVRRKGGAPLRLVYVWASSESSVHGDMGVALKEQLRTLGFDVAPVQVESPFQNRPEDWSIAVVSIGLLGVDNTPSNLNSFLRSGKPSNFGKVADPALDQAISDLEGTADSTPEQTRLLRDIQSMLSKNAYVLVLGHQPPTYVVSPAYRTHHFGGKLHIVTPDLAPSP